MENLICVTGPRGAGKETLLNTILFFVKEKIIHRVVPFTTRDKRVEETNGKEYFFLSKEEFFRIKNEKDILFSVQIGKDNEEHYFSGTFREEFDRYKNGIIDITVEGARALSSYAKNSLLLFIYALPQERCRRIMKRQNISEEEALMLMQNEPSPASIDTINFLYPEFNVLYNHDGYNKTQMGNLIKVVNNFFKI